MSKYSLNVFERLIAMQLFDSCKGNYLYWKIINTARNTLALSDEERQFHNMTFVDGVANWDNGDKFYDIELSDSAENIIIDELKKLNSQNLLEEKHFSLYEKFVVNKEKEE